MVIVNQIVAFASNEMMWLVALALVTVMAEFVWPAEEQPTVLARAQNVLIVLFALIGLALFNLTIGIHMGNFFLERGMIGLVFGKWHPHGFQYLFSTLVLVFVWDFFQYWVHRAEHTFGFLWPVHALHHEDRHVNGTTSLRNTVWSGVLLFLFAYIPAVMVCGFELQTLYGSILFFRIYGFFNHANVRLSLGGLGRVISGPQWHRLHHGRELDYYNRNFAAFFPVIDMMFGTYRHPAKDEYPATGLIDRAPGRTGALQALRDILGLANSTGGHRTARIQENR